MPKARLVKNKHLPERWRLKHGAYYYRVPVGHEQRWQGKQDFKLGSTFDESMTTYNEMISGGGDEWKDYLVDINRLPKLDAGQCVVYFLYQSEQIVYIGQTTNLSNRIADHKKDKIFSHLSYIPVTDAYKLQVEAHYIREFKPKYNLCIP